MPSSPSKSLETFPNPQPDRDYIIEIETAEFTCLCPKTGQPDFATLHLEYVPDQLCVELKALKLYIWSYRNEGAFHEKVTNTMLSDLVAALAPHYLRLRARFNVRGGLHTTVQAEYRRPGWSAPPPPPEHLPREIVTESPDNPEAAPAVSPAAVKPPARSRERVPMPEPKPAPTPTPGPKRTERFRMLARTRSSESRADAVVEAPIAPDIAPPRPARAPKPAPRDQVYVGMDVGSTGCRAIAIDEQGNILGQADTPIPAPMRHDEQVTQDPMQWWKAATAALQQLFTLIDPKKVRAIAVDGTSGTLLLCDQHGTPVTPGLMYNDRRAGVQAENIAACASSSSGAHGATSSLAKLLWLQEKKMHQRATHALHQADWISGRLLGAFGHSDYNNCLKMGYDAKALDWPGWFRDLGVEASLLPKVHTPGDDLGAISADTAKMFGLDPQTRVLAGTSDGVAAFLAAGATQPGQGVTSLGSTLVLKLLAAQPVFSAGHGVYSHRLGNYWLAGGASNSGGAVLLQYFKLEQMREMTPLLDPEQPTGLEYYPLPEIGERFPVNDPNMAPRLEPLPGDSVTFFQAMLEGIAQIEAQGYHLLAELGAPEVSAVWTTGGGADNAAWRRIRENVLKVKMEKAKSNHAAYGVARIAAGVVARAFNHGAS